MCEKETRERFPRVAGCVKSKQKETEDNFVETPEILCEAAIIYTNPKEIRFNVTRRS